MPPRIKKIVLAYSGGLDTSVILKWLQDKYDAEVITFSANLGQEEELTSLPERARAAGAAKVYIEDLQEEFVNDYVFPALKANALYESKYNLATALGRPLIAKRLVEIAREEGADAIAHGCTGKGNDQVRIELSALALAPEIKVLAPIRTWEMKSREEEIEYAREHNLDITVNKEKIYSIDRNLWGVSIECGALEDPTNAPPDDAYVITQNPVLAPDNAEEVELDFTRGIPTALNGQELDGVSLIKKLSALAGKHGIGRVDLVENRLVGIKSREIYEAPAATVLYLAHRALEELTLDRETCHFKEMLITKYSELVYNGYWFSPLREALDAFFAKTQEHVSGKVQLKLYKGNCRITSRFSDHSLYQKGLATYDSSDVFDHRLAEGFIKIWGLPLKVMGERAQKD